MIFSALALGAVLATQSASDPVVFSVAVFGCNRLEKDDWDASRNPSSANLPQLRRNFDDIAALKPIPNLLIVAGDMVLGYADDQGEAVRSQLDAWIAEYRTSNLRGKTALVPVAGNHELNRKVGKEKLASKYTTAVWNQWLIQNHLMPLKPNGPKIGGPDEVADDQTRLNFSFDAGPLHFTVLNTDTRVANAEIARIPVSWAKKDIADAARRGKTIFVVGHRNLVDPTTTTGDSPINRKQAADLVTFIKAQDRVAGYLCAHVHAHEILQIPGTKAFQVVAGNGGSKLEDDWNPPEGRSFGFDVVSLHMSGSLTVEQYSRPESNDLQPAPAKLVRSTPIGSLRTSTRSVPK